LDPSIRVIAQEMHIPSATATLIKTLPVLVGSAMRIPIGILTDRIGSRIMFSLLMLVAAASVFGLSTAANSTHLLAGGMAMRLVGTTFVVGVQSVSSWTPNNKTGLALGIFGAGNVGIAITTLGFLSC
jgi:NNP family nitrate/nitrite transporter-like MFS transporter